MEKTKRLSRRIGRKIVFNYEKNKKIMKNSKLFYKINKK
jgi:hypothetical protein